MRFYKLLPVFAFVLVSCIGNGEREKLDNADITNGQIAVDTIEIFDAFNKRFHLDSAFQLSRIAFPIGGHFADGESSQEWTARNWKLLKKPVSETATTKDYKHSLQKTDTIVIEKYWIENSGFKIERRFKKIGSKWFLTYYADINL